MIKNVKRLAQFLFDNAETIVEQLEKTDHYRALTISLDMFKHNDKPELRREMHIYDSTATHYYLYGDAIHIRRFEDLCRQLNEESGLIPPPDPIEVRDSLEPKKSE